MSAAFTVYVSKNMLRLVIEAYGVTTVHNLAPDAAMQLIELIADGIETQTRLVNGELKEQDGEVICKGAN